MEVNRTVGILVGGIASEYFLKILGSFSAFVFSAGPSRFCMPKERRYVEQPWQGSKIQLL